MLLYILYILHILLYFYTYSSNRIHDCIKILNTKKLPHFTTVTVLHKDRQGQGTNARKVILMVYAFLCYSVLSLGGKVNIRWMSQPDMESIFTKIIYEIFWS